MRLVADLRRRVQRRVGQPRQGKIATVSSSFSWWSPLWGYGLG